MNKEILEYKAELVKPLEITNEMIINGYLIGVYEDEQTVVVVKNRINGVTGRIPRYLWDQLVEDFEEIKQKVQKEAEEENEEYEENFEEEFIKGFEEFFGPLFNSAEDSYYKVKPKAEKIAQDTVSKGNVIFSNFLKDFEKLTADMKPRVQEVTEDIKKTVKETVKTESEKARLQIKKLKLQKLEEEAQELGVATKGFSKKVRNKIQDISNSLGE